MRVLPYSIFSILALFGFSAEVFAQKPSPSPTPAVAAGNLIKNSGFEVTEARSLLWSGVTSDGFLQGWGGSAPVLAQGGQMGESSMPISVAVADMNGDGKLDLITADVVGYFRVYFNIGTPQEPKFGFAELIPIYVSRTPQPEEQFRYRSNRITVGNFANSGKNELIFGNYMGEILWVKNEGSPSAPDFRQPKSRGELAVPTSENKTERWGNVFAPAAWDWNKDGKFDLLVGEGSYSANSIHVLLNQGSGPFPKFNEDNRHFLAFGDGREQLNPTVVDYNGDGKMDLLVGDRSGQIGLYLNDWPVWKPGDEIKFSSYVPLPGVGGKPATFGGICTVATGDLNKDGLFDIVVGKTNGRIAVCYNRGTAQEPKFSAPVELKGETPSKVFQVPSPTSGWETNFGLSKGNFYGYVDTVTEESEPKVAPPEGQKALKFGYLPNPNTIIRTPLTYLPALASTWGNGGNGGHVAIGPANYFTLQQSNIGLKSGKTYILTFKIKGTSVNDALVFVNYAAAKTIGEKQIIRGERTSAKVIEHVVREQKDEKVSFSPGSSWTTVTKQFKVQFANPILNEPGLGVGAYLFFSFALTPGRGEFYIDDIQLLEK